MQVFVSRREPSVGVPAFPTCKMAGTGAMRPPGGAAAMLSLPARLLTDWNYFTALSALVLLAEAVFGAAIITKVACSSPTATHAARAAVSLAASANLRSNQRGVMDGACVGC